MEQSIGFNYLTRLDASTTQSESFMAKGVIYVNVIHGLSWNNICTFYTKKDISMMENRVAVLVC